MNHSTLVSIITPTFNRAHCIDVLIKSVQAQTHPNWELLIVDDGSTDASETVVQEHSNKDTRIQFLKRPENEIKGAPTCRNLGLAAAQGDYIIFVDSDDYILPHCLEGRTKSIVARPEANFLIFPMGILENGEITKHEIEKTDDYLIHFLKFHLPWQTMCPIWEQSFIRELKGFKEGYPRLNDPELMIRALLVDDVQYQFFTEVDFDTVYIPAQLDGKIYSEKYFESLQLFIPNVCSQLDKAGKVELKPLLTNYLHVWFKDFYVPLGSSKTANSKALLKLFCKHGIIPSSTKRKLLFNLNKYAFNNYFYRNSKKQLTGRWFVK